jgi:hypothetical protein
MFERLNVFQKSIDVIDEAAALIETFPEGVWRPGQPIRPNFALPRRPSG